MNSFKTIKEEESEEQERSFPTEEAIRSESLLEEQQDFNFDQTAILDRYHQIHHEQYRQLAQLNLSQTLKQKLWGFSTGTLFYNYYDTQDMIVQNHPIKGRIIMTKQKYQSNLKIKKRQLNIKSFARNQDSLTQELTSPRRHGYEADTNQINPQDFNPSQSRDSQARLILQEGKQI